MIPKTSATIRLALVLALTAWIGLGAVCQAKEPEVSIKGPDRALFCRAGSTCKVDFVVRVKNGFHINSHKPKDADLIATKLSLKGPRGVKLISVDYPPAIRMDIPALGGKALVYEGQFTIKASLAVAKNAAPGAHNLKASLFYQACDNQMCYMPAMAIAGFKMDVKGR